MSGTVTGASPQPQGTNPSGGKPEGGNNPSAPSAGEPNSPSPSTEEMSSKIKELEMQNQMLSKNYSDSSREAQLARNQLQQSQESELMRQQAIQEQDQATQKNSDLISVSDRIIKGAYAEDSEAVASALSDFSDMSRDSGRKEAQVVQQQQQEDQDRKERRMTASKSQVQPYWNELVDQNNPTSKRVWELYVQLYNAHQSGNYKEFIPRDEEMVSGTNISVNYHLLNEARLLQEGESRNASLSSAATGNVTLESSGVSQQATVSDSNMSGPNLLSDDEKQDALRYLSRQEGEQDTDLQQRYYDNLPENVRRIREKTGKYITQQDIAESVTETLSR